MLAEMRVRVTFLSEVSVISNKAGMIKRNIFSFFGFSPPIMAD
jgi:hypothetical protein